MDESENRPAGNVTRLKAERDGRRRRRWRRLDETKTLHVARGVAILLAKALLALAVVIALARYAGPVAINAHDNTLLAVGVACFVVAGLVAIFAIAWIVDGARKLIKKLENSS